MMGRTTSCCGILEKLLVIAVAALVCLTLFVPPLLLADEGQHDHGQPPEELGVVHFPVACARGAQNSFQRGVALLHSFWNEEAQKVFQFVIREDVGCAMAYWGIAMSQWHQLGDWPDASSVKMAQEAIAKAEALRPRSAREQDYISAIALFYRDSAKGAPLARAVAYSNAMGKVYKKYPDDREAAAFYALSLLASEPDNDTTFVNRKKAAQVLEKLFANAPDHPGVAHYLIHAYDKPQLAQLGLPAAQRLAASENHSV